LRPVTFACEISDHYDLSAEIGNKGEPVNAWTAGNMLIDPQSIQNTVNPPIEMIY